MHSKRNFLLDQERLPNDQNFPNFKQQQRKVEIVAIHLPTETKTILVEQQPIPIIAYSMSLTDLYVINFKGLTCFSVIDTNCRSHYAYESLEIGTHSI